MWEVFSEGKMPFENKSNLQVVEAISKGFRLYRPYLAPMSIYEVMYSCWHEVSALTFPQRLAVSASKSRLSPMLPQDSVMAGNGFYFLVMIPESRKYFHNKNHQPILTVAFQLRNSVAFLILIFQNWFLQKLLMLLKPP